MLILDVKYATVTWKHNKWHLRDHLYRFVVAEDWICPYNSTRGKREWRVRGRNKDKSLCAHED